MLTLYINIIPFISNNIDYGNQILTIVIDLDFQKIQIYEANKKTYYPVYTIL